jgi:Xaa-Pro aminopeptidase
MKHPFLLTNSEGSGQPATQYLTGFSGSDSVLVLLPAVVPVTSSSNPRSTSPTPVIQSNGEGARVPGSGFLLLDGRYWEQGKRELQTAGYKQRTSFEIIQIHKDYTQIQALTDLMKKHSFTSVRVDSRLTSYATVLSLEKLGLQVVPEDGAMQKMREIKNEGEIQKIQNAQRIALQAFDQLLPQIKVGACERELAAKMEYLMKVNGAQGVAFDTIVASGPHSALPHATPTDRKITTADAVIVDFGARVDGYCSDFTRTILMSDAPQKLHEIYALVERAQAAAIVKAVAGTPLKDLDTVARNIIETAGYDAYFTHSLGHGVGMEVHELPHVSHRSIDVLQSGQVITIEPGIYIPGLGGIRLEEMILVK